MRVGNSYNHVVSRRFNHLISDLQLLELSLNDRQFTWARSATYKSLALLDRFFCTLDWERLYAQAYIYSLPRVFSDHSPLILKVDNSLSPKTSNFKFEKTWLSGF